MGVDAVVDEVVAEVGLWWPAADEDGLRAAAAAWERAADGLERSLTVGRDGDARARASWRGAAADRYGADWRRHDTALHDDADACRALAAGLLRYADAVADAKQQVIELAVTAGATVVAGAGLAWFTFGASAAAAGAVTAGLVAAAEAIGVQLSATAAAVLGGALTGVAFGAVEAAAVDAAVAQPLRVEAFGRGGYSLGEVGGAASVGGVAGGALGGVAGGLGAAASRAPAVPTSAAPTPAVPTPAVPVPAVPAPAGPVPAARTAVDDLGELDSAITAALDPARRGVLGPLFRPGVHDAPGAPLAPEQLPAARLLGDEGHSVHPPSTTSPSSSVLVRSSPADHGRPTELVSPDAPTAEAVEHTLLEAAGRLGRDAHGHGDVVLDARAIGLDVDTAGQGLVAAVERATEQRLVLPDSVRFVFDDRSIHFP